MIFVGSKQLKSNKENGLMKQFVKALPKEGKCCSHHCEHLPKAKLKEDVFIERDMKKLLRHENFESRLQAFFSFFPMEKKDKKSLESFKLVVIGFLGNKKEPSYKIFVTDLLECNM